MIFIFLQNHLTRIASIGQTSSVLIYLCKIHTACCLEIFYPLLFLFLYLKLQLVATVLLFIGIVFVYKGWKWCSVQDVILDYFI